MASDIPIPRWISFPEHEPKVGALCYVKTTSPVCEYVAAYIGNDHWVNSDNGRVTDGNVAAWWPVPDQEGKDGD